LKKRPGRLHTDCTAPTILKKSDWGHSAIFKMAMEDFPVLMAPSDSMLSLEVFDRKYLVKYPSWEIWLSEADAWLPSDGLEFYIDGSLFVSLSFRLRFTPLWLVPTTI
jgi:hypothetical protein